MIVYADTSASIKWGYDAVHLAAAQVWVFQTSVESIPNLWYHNGVIQIDATIRSCAANWLWKAE